MPNCKNQTKNKLISEEVVSGVNIGTHIFHACGQHSEKDILDNANKFFESKAVLMQLTNPIQGIKVRKNPNSTAK